MMSTVAERQKLSLEFDSVASASGYFSVRVGSMDRTVAIPYDAVSKETGIKRSQYAVASVMLQKKTMPIG